METVNGGSLGEDKGGPPPPSPLTGCYLLVVVGEPHSDEHKDIILQRVAKGLLSWDATNCLVDLEKELSTITDQGLEGEEARYGERLIQFASENLVTEILIHPAVSTLSQCVRNLLSSFTRHRHIIHAGFTFQGNGSWALQDGTFSYSDFCEALQEIEVQRVIHAYENGISIDLHCSPEGDWTRMPKETYTKACKIRVNPTDVLSTGSSSISNFIKYLAPFLVPTSLENILESSDVVGNIRFSRPTLYVFPGGQGDAALFGINGFNMLLDGGYSRKACFWDFVRHLDRLDAVLMTRLNNSSLCGISSVLKRKRQGAVYPQVGHFFCNIQERKSLPSPDGDKDRDPLIFSILDEGQSIVQDLHYLNLIPQSCYRDNDPIILYHKVGHGTLNMYVLSPDKNSREVREFLQKWNQCDPKLFAGSRGGRDFSFPLQNLVSICALLVWQPANPNDTITRILYPGSTPQKKIFEGLDRLKSLECIKHALCSEKSLAPVKKSKQEVIEKLSSKDKVITEKRTENKLIEDAMKHGEMNGDVVREKQVKKSDSLESDKEKKTKRVEDGKKAEKIEDVEKIVENGEKAKPKIKSGDVKPIKKRGDSQHRKKPAPEKKGPTTPKKTVENKTNGDIKEKKAAQRPSPSATPAKSTKDANNRRVVENKKTLPKKEAVATAAAAPKPAPSSEAKPKPERKPISRRPKTIKGPPSPMKKMTNGVQKPDSISKRGKLDKEGTTDSSTVSTPSADQESVLKKDLSKLTPEEIQQLKDKELDELKEEQEAVKEIEAVFRKGEGHDEEAEPGVRKIKEVSIDDNLEVEEYLIIEKEEIEHDSLDQEFKEDEMQKLARDSEESEKQRKMSSEEKEIDLQKEEEGKEFSSQEVLSKEDVPEKIIEDAESKKPQVSSPEDKGTPTTDKKDLADEEVKEVVESHPEEKVSANVESGATTTAPTLPEDERITLDDIKEDNGQHIEEKHVKEETKEKEVPIIQLPPQSQQDSHPKIPFNVEIALDKQKHIRDIVKTPDEVADLPVHEEADYHEFHGDGKKNNETDICKEQDKKIEEKREDSEIVNKSKEEVIKVEEQLQKEVLKEITDEVDETVKDIDNLKEATDKKGDTDVPEVKEDMIKELPLTQDHVKDIAKDIKTESKAFLEQEILSNDVVQQEPAIAALTGVSDVEKSLETDKNVPEEGIIKTDETQNFEILEKAELETKEKGEIESDILKEKLKESIDDEWVVITKEDEQETNIVETAQEADASIDNKKQIVKETSGDDIIVKDVTDVTKTADLKEEFGADHPISKNIDDELDDQLQTDLEKENKNVTEKVLIGEFTIAKQDELVEESAKKDVDKTTKLQKEDKEITKEKEVECESELDEHEIHKEDEIHDILEKDTEDIKALIDEADKITTTDNNVEDIKEPTDDPETNIKMPTITDEKVNIVKETKDAVEVIKDEVQELKKEVSDSREEINLDRMKRDLSKIEEPLCTDLKQEAKQLAKIDDQLQELKRVVEDLSIESEEFQIEKSTKSPEHAEQVTLPDSSPEDGDHLTFGELDIDKTELGRKSPAEREEDVKKIVVSVAEVLKSEAPLEELQGKLPFTQELRETHITTQDSPILEAKVIINDDIPPIPEEPMAEELTDVTDRRKDLIADAQQLMAASSKVISDIKSKADENVDKVEEIAEKTEKHDDKVEANIEKESEEDNKGKELIKAEEKDDKNVDKEEKIAGKSEKHDDKVEAKVEKGSEEENKGKELIKAEEKDDKNVDKEEKIAGKSEKHDDKVEAKVEKGSEEENKGKELIKAEEKGDKNVDKEEDIARKSEKHDDKVEVKVEKGSEEDNKGKEVIKAEEKGDKNVDKVEESTQKAKKHDDKVEVKVEKESEEDNKGKEVQKSEEKDDDGNIDKLEEIAQKAEKHDDKVEVKVAKASKEDDEDKDVVNAGEKGDKAQAKVDKTEAKDNKTEDQDNKTEAKDIKTEDNAEAKDSKIVYKDHKIEDKANKAVVKDDKVDNQDDKAEDLEDKDDDSGTVHRMLVTASSEDGGEEIEICPPGTITFSKSSESSGRSSPEPSQKTPSQKSSIVETLSDTLSTVKQITEKDLDIEKQEDNKNLEGEESVEKSSVLDSIRDAFDSAKEIVKEKIEDLTKDTTEAQTKIQGTESIVPDTVSSAETLVIDPKDDVKAEIKTVEKELEKTEDKKEILSDAIKSSHAENLSEQSQEVSVEKGDEKVVEELTSFKTSIGEDVNKLVSDSTDIEKSVEDKIKDTVKEIENVTDKPIKAKEELTHTINEDDLDAQKIVASKSKDLINTEQFKGSLTNIADEVEHKIKEIKEPALEKAQEVLTDISDKADGAKEAVENKIDDDLKVSEEAKDSIKKETQGLEHLDKKEIVDGEKLDNEFKDGLSKAKDNIEDKIATTATSKDLKDEAKSADLENEKCIVISESDILPKDYNDKHDKFAIQTGKAIDLPKDVEQTKDITENKITTKVEEDICEAKSVLVHVEECARKVKESVEQKVHEVKDEISSKINATVTESAKVHDDVKDDVSHIGHELEHKIQDNADLVLSKVDNLVTKPEEVQEVFKEAVEEKVQEVKEKTTDTKHMIVEQTEEVVDNTGKLTKDIKDEVKEDRKVAEEAILKTKKDVSEKINDMSATVLDITDKIEETIGIKAEEYTEAKADKLDRKVEDGKDKVEDKPVEEESIEKTHGTSAPEIDDSLKSSKESLESTKQDIEKIVESNDNKINYSDIEPKDVVPERTESVIENVIDNGKNSLISKEVETIGDKSEDLKPSDVKSAEENSTNAETAEQTPNRRESLIERAEDILEKSEKAIESVFSAIGDAASSVLQEMLPEHKSISSEIKSVGEGWEDKKLSEDLDKGKSLDTSPALSERYIQDVTEGHLTKEREELNDLGDTSLQTEAKLISDKVAEDVLISSSVLETAKTTNDSIESKLKNIDEKVSDMAAITEHKIDQACDIIKDSLESIEGKVANDIQDKDTKEKSAGVEKAHDSPQKSDDIHDTLKKSAISEEAATETKGDESADLKSCDTKTPDAVSSAKTEGQPIPRRKESLVEKAEDILEKSERAIESVFSAIGDAAKSVFNEILPDENNSAGEIKTDDGHVKQEDKHDIESIKEAPPSSEKSSPGVSGKDDNLEVSPVISGTSTPDKPKDKIREEIKPTQESSDIIKEPIMMTTNELEFEDQKEIASKVDGTQGLELTKDDTKDSEKISVHESTSTHESVIETAEKFIEESEKTVESVFSAIGSAAKSILHDIMPEDKDNKASEENEKSEDKKDVGKEKTDEVKKEDLQKEEKNLDNSLTEISVECAQGLELTKDDTKDSEKISVHESTSKHGGVVEAVEKLIEESEKTVESVFSAIGSAATSILHDIIPEDKDNKASEENQKSEDKKDVEKEKTGEVKKEDLEKEEKHLDDNFTEISDSKFRTKPSDSSTSDENKIDKHIVEKIETKSITFAERNIDDIEGKSEPKRIEILDETFKTVSDLTKSTISEKDEDAIKTEQKESGPSSITVIDSNKLEDIRHSTEDKSEKKTLVNEHQEKKDPEKEHDTLEEKVEEKLKEIKTIQNEFKENIKQEQEFKKDKSEQLVEDDMTKSVYVEKSESSHESHKLDDRISESSKTDKTGDVHKEKDPSLNAKDSVVLDDQPTSSQTEKCEKESMEKTTSEKDSDNLKVEHTDRKKLSISDVEISIKTDDCPQDPSQIFLDNERAILRDNIDAKMYVQPIVSQGDDLAGSSTISQVTAEAISDKSSPELEISGKTTPPTVLVSPISKEIKSPSSKLDSGLSEQTETDDEDLSTKSQIAHSQSDLDELDMKMDPMSMSFYGALPEDHADGEEVPATLLYEITKAKYTTELKQEGEDHQEKKGEVDLMTASFIGQLPSASKSTDSKEDDSKKDPVDSWGKPLSLPAPTYMYEVTKAKFTSSTEDLMTSSFIGDTLPSSSSKDRSQETTEPSAADPMTTSVYFEHSSDSAYDPIASWGKPLGLPSPAPPNNDKGTPKKERKLPAYVTAKNKLNDDKKRAESPSKLRAKKTNPVYVDLTYVPHHGNHYYSYVDFFKKIRARYYVFSGLEPSRQVYDALLEAKQTWEDKELEVTIIPTYDTDILGYWVAENEELLSKFKIDLSPSASRCTINLQDHETSCSAYRLEF